jgi:viologen exporter family transport system permease protein
MAAGATPLQAYRAVFSARFILMLQYRAAAAAGFATQCWWGMIKVMVFAAFFYGASPHQPLSFPQVLAYVWLGQAFLMLMPWWGDPEITEMVRSGNISYERLRPLDTYFFWYVRAMAWITARMAPRAIMMFVFAALIIPVIGLANWRLPMPPNLEAAAFFVLAMILAVLLSSATLMLINILIVVTVTDRGPGLLATQIVTLLSGILVPLPFFPGSMRSFLFFQPFAGLADIPFRIYSGNLTGALAMTGLAIMVCWIAAFIAAGHWLIDRVMARLQVQGG